MKRAKGRKGQGEFRPDPKRDESLVNGIREFMGDPDADCTLMETKDGALYLYQRMPEFHATEDELVEYRKNPSQHKPLDFDDHILIQRLSRAEAIRWALELFLPDKLRRQVKILGEGESS